MPDHTVVSASLKLELTYSGAKDSDGGVLFGWVISQGDVLAVGSGAQAELGLVVLQAIEQQLQALQAASI